MIYKAPKSQKESGRVIKMFYELKGFAERLAKIVREVKCIWMLCKNTV